MPALTRYDIHRLVFFLNHTPTTNIYTLSLHDALPIYEVITFLVSMQISISSLQTHNVNRCGRSRHLARKLSLRSKRSSPNVFEMAATETITSIISIKLIRVSLGTVRHPRRFRSEERFSRNAETDLVCRLLLEKKKNKLRECGCVR